MSGAILEAIVNNIVARYFYALRGSFDVVFCFYLFLFFWETLFISIGHTRHNVFWGECYGIFFFIIKYRASNN